MTVDQMIALAGHIAWPVAAIIGLLLLPFYMRYVTQLTVLVTKAQELLKSTDKMADLIGKFENLKGTLAPLELQISALKTELQFLPALSPSSVEGAPIATTAPDIEALVATVKVEWEKAKSAIKKIASLSGIAAGDLSGIGASTSAVQAVADSLIERKVIDAGTAILMTDLSNQFQLWTRSRNRNAYLNDGVVSEFSAQVTGLVQKLSQVA